MTYVQWCQNGICVALWVEPSKVRSGDFMKYKQLLLGSLAAGALLTAALMSFKFHIFEAHLYDFRMRSQGVREKNPHTAIITIDDATLDKLAFESTLNLHHYVELLKYLSANSNVKAIGLLSDLNKPLLEESKTNATLHMNEFLELAQKFNRSGAPLILGTPFEVTGEVLPPEKLRAIPHGLALVHKDGNLFSEDKVTRRALYSVNSVKTFHTLIAETISGKDHFDHYASFENADAADARFFFINYGTSTKSEKSLVKEYSFLDVLEKKVPLSAFDGKIVLIGPKSDSNSNDYTYTPFSRELFTNSKLQVHAQIIETLLHDDAILLAPKWSTALVTLFLTTLIIFSVFNTTPMQGVTITVFLTSLFVLTSLVVFKFTDVAISMARPLLGIFFSYYVFVPYRLIQEFKSRASYQKKHEVLMQVDELKRNFMNLITHDLKTPVARIHGLAEMLGRSGSDIKIVSEVMKSTEELNRFITSILELAKVETKEMTLNKSSKDINRIVEECIKSHRFDAKAKNIEIEAQLEPLFPIYVDPLLITRVISNLLDNAIKYSPSGSVIHVTSKESSDHSNMLEVTVSDNGPGINQKDLEHIFHKFFRPSNDLTMQVKGYGLGLYLSKYFTELHKGALEVSSEEGKGTSFKVSLPFEGGTYA